MTGAANLAQLQTMIKGRDEYIIALTKIVGGQFLADSMRDRLTELDTMILEQIQ